MAKKTKSIDELLADANAGIEASPNEFEEDAPEEAAPVVGAPSTPPGMTRIRILMADHTDGRLKKTWKEGSVIEIDQYTAARMIAKQWAAPTAAPINEILLEYKGKK